MVMTKIAYNTCYGGFSLSHDAIMRYAEIKGIKLYPFIGDLRGDLTDTRNYKHASREEALEAFCVHYCTTPEYSDDSYWSDRDIDRTDPALIQVIEEMGAEAGGRHASLAVKEISAGTKYRIDEYDGNESVETIDSYDWKTA
jgi:hypothetical protein